MYGSRFQKRHKQRNVHNDHYVTNDTAIIVDISFYTCAERSKPLVSVYILPSPYSQKTSRYRKRKAYPYICDNFDFPCFVPHAFKPACLPFPHRAMADKPIFRQCAAKGTPATASHACMTMAVTGLPSRRQESSAFPFIFASPFIYLRGALRHTICSFFLFASPPVCLRSHAAFRTASACHFRCWGKGNSGIVRGCKVKPPCGCPEKSPPSQVQVVFCPTNLASPNPYL